MNILSDPNTDSTIQVRINCNNAARFRGNHFSSSKHAERGTEGGREGGRESHLVSVRFTKLLQAIMTGQRLQTVVKSDCYSCVKTVLRRTKPEVK